MVRWLRLHAGALKEKKKITSEMKLALSRLSEWSSRSTDYGGYASLG